MKDKNRNLALRVATALVLLPVVLWLIWRGELPFAVLLAVAAGACALELNLLPRQQAAFPEEGRSLSGAAIASVAGAALMPLLSELRISSLTAKGSIAIVVVIALTDELLFEKRIEDAPRRVGLALLGTVYPGVLISALVPLRARAGGEWWIILALTVTWLNDTGAYFAGRAFGKHKLYPRISPSKTWEGAAGGTLGSIVGALVVQHFWLPQLAPAGAAVIGAGAAVLGPLGDLSESMLKRAFGAKDSSHLLPGHGGILDRIDALLFNAPFVLLLARLYA